MKTLLSALLVLATASGVLADGASPLSCAQVGELAADIMHRHQYDSQSLEDALAPMEGLHPYFSALVQEAHKVVVTPVDLEKQLSVRYFSVGMELSCFQARYQEQDGQESAKMQRDLSQ